jgi:hypothetical protein
MSAGTRGKWAEKKVRDQLKVMGLKADFNYMRLPDARAGSFQPTIGDFLVVRRKVPTFVEVKEVDHEYRLPAKNFSSDQRGRLKAFEAAGAQTLIVVCFTPLRLALSPRQQTTEPVWRAAEVSYFDVESDRPSWDMRDLMLYPIAEILEKCL